MRIANRYCILYPAINPTTYGSVDRSAVVTGGRYEFYYRRQLAVPLAIRDVVKGIGTSSR